jgi:serine/threonine-protein kinase HipA
MEEQMNRHGKVYMNDNFTGIISESEDGYTFVYEQKYLDNKENLPVSQTLPFKKDAYKSPVLFPFFDGLIPEGWLLEIAEKNWKLKSTDRMGLLLACCKDCIGAVSVVPSEKENEKK